MRLSNVDQAALEAAIGLSPADSAPLSADEFWPSHSSLPHDTHPVQTRPLSDTHSFVPEILNNPLHTTHLNPVSDPRPSPIFNPDHDLYRDSHHSSCRDPHHLPYSEPHHHPHQDSNHHPHQDPNHHLQESPSHNAVPDPLRSLNLSSSTLSVPTPPSTTAPVSAVEHAKQLAEDFTRRQLAEKRGHSDPDRRDAKRVKCASGSSCSDDAAPEVVSRQRYQKRLQKNRDSAFVSRIRRREYTRLLEEMLLAVEKERDAALDAFRGMKQRCEVVVAELSGIRHTALNLVGFRAGAGEAGEVEAEADSRLLETPQVARPGTAVTMFMFALMFGSMVPDVGKWMPGSKTALQPVRAGVTEMTPRSSGGWSWKHLSLWNKEHVGARKGTVWGLTGARTQRSKMHAFPDAAALPRLMQLVRNDAQAVVGREAAAFCGHVEKALRGFSFVQLEEVESSVKAVCGGGAHARLNAVAQIIASGRGNASERDVSEVRAALLEAKV